MEILVYVLRSITVLLFSWLCIRLIGKRSISQLSAYDFTALMIFANVAAEPLVFKISSKAFIGCLSIVLFAIVVGKISLQKTFYNVDSKPEIVIVNGKVDKDSLRKNRMNLPFLLSLLRLQGYSKVSDVEFAIIEPDGNVSVIPTSQSRPVSPNDLKLDTLYEGITLPLIIDGEIQYNNLRFAKLDINWLDKKMAEHNVSKAEEVFLAELDSSGNLYFDLFKDNLGKKPGIF